MIKSIYNLGTWKQYRFIRLFMNDVSFIERSLTFLIDYSNFSVYIMLHNDFF